MRSRDEASRDPAGQHSPFESVTMTLSAPATRADNGAPVATAAFQRRAPSTWTRSPASWAAAIKARIPSAGVIAPPARLWVFSMTRREAAARLSVGGFRARRTIPGVRIPSWACTILGTTPERTAMPDSSYSTTWLRSSTITWSPGRVRIRIAISFPIVPVGTKSAASNPRRRATSSWRRLTVGSSP